VKEEEFKTLRQEFQYHQDIVIRLHKEMIKQSDLLAMLTIPSEGCMPKDYFAIQLRKLMFSIIEGLTNLLIILTGLCYPDNDWV
jgi:hypothetical protein